MSLVLTGSTSVSDRRRAAVLAAIEELGYTPSRAASTLAGARTRTIGIAIEDFSNLWFVELLRGAREVLEPQGYQVLVGDHPASALPGRDGLASMHVDGLILAFDPEEVPEIRHDLPYVVAGQRLNQPPGADVVTNDDEAGGRLLTEHLLGLGHVDVLHVTGRGGAAAARRRGYESAMGAAGLDAVVVGEGGETGEAPARDATRAHLAAGRPVTAVFAANDAMALGAMGALREVGLAVPDDVSVAGYDDSPLAAASYLDLTTANSRSLDVGRESARILLDRVGGAAHDPHWSLLEPTLVLRSSTAAAVRPTPR